MDKCPKCGGTGGYTYKILVPYIQWVDWHGNPQGAESGTSGAWVGKIGECANCHYRFNMKKKGVNGAI